MTFHVEPHRGRPRLCARCGERLEEIPGEPTVEAVGFPFGRRSHAVCEQQARGLRQRGYRRGPPKPKPPRSSSPRRHRLPRCEVCEDLIFEIGVRLPGSDNAHRLAHAACADRDRAVPRIRRSLSVSAGFDDDACAFSEHRCWIPLEQLPWPDDASALSTEERFACRWADEAIAVNIRATRGALIRRERGVADYWRGPNRRRRHGPW